LSTLGPLFSSEDLYLNIPIVESFNPRVSAPARDLCVSKCGFEQFFIANDEITGLFLTSLTMSCVIDLAELFGDETIEVIDTGGSKSLDIPETTIIVNSPFDCCGTPKRIDMVDEYDYEYEEHQTSDTEAGSGTETRIDPESDSDGEEEKKSIDPGLEQPSCCDEYDCSSAFCSPTFFHHVDVRAQAESRRVELEDLRQRSLAKPKGMQ
jgi:hypothetical protein